MFIMPNSCPFALGKINLPIFPPLMTNGGAVAAIDAKDQTPHFSADLAELPDAKKYMNADGKGLYLTYTTGQQLPVSVEIMNVKWCGSKIEFDAPFPYTKNGMQGFSHAAITSSNKFDSADAVVKATLAGPGVIQVRNPVNGS